MTQCCSCGPKTDGGVSSFIHLFNYLAVSEIEPCSLYITLLLIRAHKSLVKNCALWWEKEAISDAPHRDCFMDQLKARLTHHCRAC